MHDALGLAEALLVLNRFRVLAVEETCACRKPHPIC